MKILYVVGAYGPRYLANEIHRELVQEFARRGHACIVFAGVTPDELQDDPVSYTDGPVSVQRQLIDTRGRDRGAAEIGRRVFRYPRFLPLLRGLRRVLHENPDIDVIHADAMYPIGAIAALAAFGHRAALAPSIHGGDLIDYPGYGYGRFPLTRQLIRWTFGRSALVRVNSPLMARQALALGCDPAKLHEILVNIGDRFFVQDRSLADVKEAARKTVCDRHDLDPAAPLLVSTGRLLPLKGFHDLVAAMAIVRQARPDARLIIAGPNFVDPQQGDQRAALQRAIAAQNLTEQIVLRDSLNYETEMAEYLAAADLMVAVAHIEGLNRVVAEAGSQGTPSIVSTMTGVAPLVERLRAGCVVAPRDPQALAATILDLLDHQEKRAALARNAQRLAQRFRSAVVADALLALYAQSHHSIVARQLSIS